MLGADRPREAALGWVEAALWIDDEDVQADAIGVLVHIGIPKDWMPRLRALSKRKSEASDILFEWFQRADEPPLPEQDSAGDYRTVAERKYEEKLLLHGTWAPVTKTMVFVRATVDETERVLIDGVRGQKVLEQTGFPLVSSPVQSTTLAGLLQLLMPLDAMLRRYLLLPTAHPEWTAVFDCSLYAEGSPVTWFAVGGLECVTVVDSPQRRDYPNRTGSYGQRSLSNTVPTTPGEYEHFSTRTGRDERRWYFVEEPMPVGNISDPTARSVAKRFTHDHLAELAARFGLQPFDENFYAPDGHGVLVMNTDPPAPDYLSFTLAQMRGEEPR